MAPRSRSKASKCFERFGRKEYVEEANEGISSSLLEEGAFFTSTGNVPARSVNPKCSPLNGINTKLNESE